MTHPRHQKRPFPFARLLKDGGYSMVLNLLCAIMITLVGGGDHFFDNLVISMCVGTLAFLIIDIARLSIWGEGFRIRWSGFALIVLAAVPLAQVGGGTLAGKLIHTDISHLQTLGSSRTITWMLFTLMAVSSATGFFVIRDRMARAVADAALEKARAEANDRQAMQAQLQLLQAQIEPHMLFNTLANLQGLIAIDPARAQAMLDQLIQYLRATLSSSRAGSTTLEQEFSLIEAYLGLMSVRMGPRLRYTLDLPAALRHCTLPPMLLQPLVENAIIHGLEPKLDGGSVAIRASLAGASLRIEVADTGLGLEAGSASAPASAPAKHGGTRVGVANTRERLRSLFGEQAGLTLEANPGQGALARLHLPFTTA